MLHKNIFITSVAVYEAQRSHFQSGNLSNLARVARSTKPAQFLVKTPITAKTRPVAFGAKLGIKIGLKHNPREQWGKQGGKTADLATLISPGTNWTWCEICVGQSFALTWLSWSCEFLLKWHETISHFNLSY